MSLKQSEFGVYDAVPNFNIGHKAIVLIYEKLGMIPGRYMLKGCEVKNRRRLFHSIYFKFNFKR